jgi:hypothetical protein
MNRLRVCGSACGGVERLLLPQRIFRAAVFGAPRYLARH